MTNEASQTTTTMLEPHPGRPSPRHRRAAARAIHRPGLDERVIVEVFEHRGQLDVTVTVPPETPPSLRSWIRHRVHAGLRHYDRSVGRIAMTIDNLP